MIKDELILPFVDLKTEYYDLGLVKRDETGDQITKDAAEATKRYRSNCINWGIVPFTIAKDVEFNYEQGDKVFIPGIREAILAGKEEIDAQVITKDGVKPIHLFFQNLTANERQILADGCLMNFYASSKR